MFVDVVEEKADLLCCDCDCCCGERESCRNDWVLEFMVEIKHATQLGVNLLM